MLPRHACCVLSRLRCNGHSLLLGSYLSMIGRIENPSCSACGHSSQDTPHSALSSYGFFAPLTFWRLSVSLQPLVQAVGSCPTSGTPWSSAMPPSLERGRAISNNNKLKSRFFLSHVQSLVQYKAETNMEKWIDKLKFNPPSVDMEIQPSLFRKQCILANMKNT